MGERKRGERWKSEERDGGERGERVRNKERERERRERGERKREEETVVPVPTQPHPHLLPKPRTVQRAKDQTQKQS
jgi:hypothetical protein